MMPLDDKAQWQIWRGDFECGRFGSWVDLDHGRFVSRGG
jgi:hypothetical protein